jgi:hypothetical protein
LPDRLIGHDDSPLGQKIPGILEAQAEAMIGPDRIADDRDRSLFIASLSGFVPSYTRGSLLADFIPPDMHNDARWSFRTVVDVLSRTKGTSAVRTLTSIEVTVEEREVRSADLNS